MSKSAPDLDAPIHPVLAVVIGLAVVLALWAVVTVVVLGALVVGDAFGLLLLVVATGVLVRVFRR